MEFKYCGKNTGIFFRYFNKKDEEIFELAGDVSGLKTACSIIVTDKSKKLISSLPYDEKSKEYYNFMMKHNHEILVDKEIFNSLNEKEQFALLLHEYFHSCNNSFNESLCDRYAERGIGKKFYRKTVRKIYNLMIKKNYNSSLFIKEIYSILKESLTNENNPYHHRHEWIR